MDLGVVMSGEGLADKLADGCTGRHPVAMWNTRRVPRRLTPGWTNRLYVACGGWWRGYFPLWGDVLWTLQDAAAPYALIFDPRRWTPIAAVPALWFRGWRYLALPPGGEATSAAERFDGPREPEGSTPPRTSRRGVIKRSLYFPHRLRSLLPHRP
ncbi:MAG: hypothetical protein ACE5JD_10285 [Candidatus Methylomirabilia bacterium]